jgi:hypothetical protein
MTGLFPTPADGYGPRTERLVRDPESTEEQTLMASSPFRRRKAAKTVRNLAIAEAALALAKDRAAAATGRRSRRPSGKLLLLGGVAAAAGAAALLKRDKVARLLPSRPAEPAPFTPVPPQPSNYDAPGPVANTATPVPAPDPHGEPPATIDEQAEEDAAAAEAAAIGGSPADYAGSEPGEPADEAFRPLAEAGEGESEGQEQAEADLADNATYRDGGLSDAERQIDDTIEQADQPFEGERPEPVASGDSEPGAGASDETTGVQEAFLPPSPPTPAPAPAAEPAPEPAADPAAATDETAADTPGGGISGRPYSGLDTPPESDADSPAPSESGSDAPSESEPQSGSDDDWRTWSGRSVNP